MAASVAPVASPGQGRTLVRLPRLLTQRMPGQCDMAKAEDVRLIPGSWPIVLISTNVAASSRSKPSKTAHESVTAKRMAPAILPRELAERLFPFRANNAARACRPKTVQCQVGSAACLTMTTQTAAARTKRVTDTHNSHPELRSSSGKRPESLPPVLGVVVSITRIVAHNASGLHGGRFRRSS